MRTVTGLNEPYGIAFNSRGEMIVAERGSHQVSVFNNSGQRIRSFGSRGHRAENMIWPAGIAINDKDNIYVTSQHKLQKFTTSGELIKCVGQEGRKEGEFDNPCGVTLYNNQLYVCDNNNHRIQVFDLALNFIQAIVSYGKGRGKFKSIDDVKFDSVGNMYVVEDGKRGVQLTMSYIRKKKRTKIAVLPISISNAVMCNLSLHLQSKGYA